VKVNINRPSAPVRRRQRDATRREWHSKFAWVPTAVDETEEGKSVVWFENYMRKGWTNSPRKRAKWEFEKYSKRNYFKKKLNGDFDAKKEEGIMADTSASIGTVGSGLYYQGSSQWITVPASGTTTFNDSDITMFYNGQELEEEDFQIEFEFKFDGDIQ